MIDSNFIYSGYPLFAAGCCLLLLKRAWVSGAQTQYIALFANLAVINFCQVVIYSVMNYSFVVAGYAADVYLVSVYFLGAHFMQLSLSMKEGKDAAWLNYLYVFPVFLALMHLSGYLVDSYRLEDGAILHNDGAYSWLMEGFLLSSAVVSIAAFKKNEGLARREENYLMQSRNIIARISFYPFIIAGVLLVILSNSDKPVPVIFVIPTLSLYIVCIFYYVSKSRIIDLSIGPKPFLRRMMTAYKYLLFVNTKKDLDGVKKDMDLTRYKEALQRHKNNFSAAAEELQMHPTTLRNAINKK